MNRGATILLLAVVAILLTAFGWLLSLRFARGDTYPPHSSLRPDPLGTKALYESLDRLPGYTVGRNHRQPAFAELPKRATMVIPGVEPWGFGWTSSDRLRHHVAHGGRVILALGRRTFTMTPDEWRDFRGDDGEPADADPDSENGETTGDADAEDDTGSDGDDAEEVAEPPFTWWPPALLDVRSENPARRAIRTSRSAPGRAFPAQIEWPATRTFDPVEPPWEVIYETLRGEPVVVRRPLGRGEIIVLAEAFLLTNQALDTHRETALLRALFPNPGPVVFDEFNLGVESEMTVGALLQRYRLGGVLAAALAVALLWIWSRFQPLVPPVAQGSGPQPAAGGHRRVGLVPLLRRTIPPSRILSTCFEEWRNTFLRQAGNPRRYDERAQQAEALLEQAGALSRDRDAARRRNELYRKTTEILQTRESL